MVKRGTIYQNTLHLFGTKLGSAEIFASNKKTDANHRGTLGPGQALEMGMEASPHPNVP